MASSFAPKTTKPFFIYPDEMDDPQSQNEQKYRHDLLKILDPDGFGIFKKALNVLFPLLKSTKAPITESELKSCWKLLRIGFGMQKLMREDEVTEDDMKKLGFRFITRRYEYADEKGMLRHVDINDNPLFCCSIRGAHYIEFIQNAISAYPQFPETALLSKINDEHYELHIACTTYNTETETRIEKCNKDYVSATYDALCTLHFHCLHTGSFNGYEIRYTQSNLCLMWWLLYDSDRRGRIDVCPICASPFFVERAQGVKQVYCSEQCRNFYRNNKERIGEQYPLSRSEFKEIKRTTKRGRPKGSKKKSQDVAY